MKIKNILYAIAVIFAFVACISLLSSMFSNREQIPPVVPDESDETPPTTEEKSPFEGLYIAFLGDGITTYDGYSNNSYYGHLSANSAYYPSAKSIPAINIPVNETYWYKTMDELSLKLSINQSRWDEYYDISSVAAYSEMMRSNVHKPDIVVVYVGTFDLFDVNNTSADRFYEYYGEVIWNIQNTYPDAEIYLCNLIPCDLAMDKVSSLRSYNSIIRELAEEEGCILVDFHNNSGITFDNMDDFIVDGCFPTTEGMEKLSEVLTKTIKENSKYAK